MTTFSGIPVEVLLSDVLPCFELRELLRLRRVCRWTKSLSEDFLRVHPPSRRNGLFLELGMKDQDKASSLTTFLKSEAEISIPMPCNHFNLLDQKYEIDTEIIAPIMATFVERYGDLVVRLDLCGQCVVKNTPTQYLDFLNKFPNLKELSVMWFTLDVLGEIDFESPDALDDLVLPSAFRKLTYLKINNWLFSRISNSISSDPAERALVWKVFEICENLKYFQYPSFPYDTERTPPDWTYDENFETICQILGRNIHKNFRVIDLRGIWRHVATHKPIPALWELTLKHGIMWTNVKAGAVSNLAHKYQADLLEVADKINSIKEAYLTMDLNGVALPNVKEMQLDVKSFLNDGQEVMPVPEELENFRRSVSPEILPNLRALRISMKRTASVTSATLSTIWPFLLCLEEVSFDLCPSNAAFLGVNEELPFLLLTQLRKLDLGQISVPKGCIEELGGSVTDTAFLAVFRNMTLRQFRFNSDGPIRSFTSAGIRGLQSGIFMEAIENFTFGQWSLADLDKDEFQQLAREFPPESAPV